MSTQSVINAVYISLANALRDEGTNYRLGLRIDILIDYLQQLRSSSNVDLILLTEGRICRTSDESDMMDAMDIAYKIAKSLGMWFTMSPNNGSSKMAFSKIAIYDPTKLFLLESRNYYPGESLDLPSGYQFSQCISGFKFHRILSDTYNNFGHCKNDDSLIFNLGFIHTPVNKDGRDKFFEMMIREFSTRDEPWIFPGDYNLIEEDSDEQKKLLDNHFLNMSKDVGITFVGYPHDVDSNGNPYRSSLDRVYINDNFRAKFGNDINVNVEDVEYQGIRISDHFVMNININFSSNN